MASYFDQWMSAFQELRTGPVLGNMSPTEWHGWRDKLTDARLLISEENDPKTQMRGGELIREVRQAARRAREEAAA